MLVVLLVCVYVWYVRLNLFVINKFSCNLEYDKQILPLVDIFRFFEPHLHIGHMIGQFLLIDKRKRSKKRANKNIKIKFIGKEKIVF